jgi:hypothetical protein
VDDTNHASGLANTSSSNPPGAGNTYTDLAQEAARAVAHFKITDLAYSSVDPRRDGRHHRQWRDDVRGPIALEQRFGGRYRLLRRGRDGPPDRLTTLRRTPGRTLH